MFPHDCRCVGGRAPHIFSLAFLWKSPNCPLKDIFVTMMKITSNLITIITSCSLSTDVHCVHTRVCESDYGLNKLVSDVLLTHPPNSFQPYFGNWITLNNSNPKRIMETISMWVCILRTGNGPSE